MSKRKASESNESEAELDDDHEEFATNTNGPPPMKRRRRLPVEAYKYVTVSHLVNLPSLKQQTEEKTAPESS